MDEEQKEKMWDRYSSVWRNILTSVLEWPTERVDQYIGELRREMESCANDPANFGFFYDLPSRYLWSALLGGGLYKKLQGNTHSIYQRLTHAIAGSHIEREMEKPDFDWIQAKRRYQSERRKIEEWLATLENSSGN